VRKEIDNLKDKLLNVCKRMDIVNVCKRMCAKGCDKNVKQKREALEIYGRDLVEVKLDRVVGASIGCIGATTVDEYSKCVQKHATFVEPRRRTPLSQIEKEWLLQLGDRLHNRVVGQDQAVNAVVDAVVRSRAGFGRPRHPIGSFLFLGPTGVGKTELAKALAEQLFDDENQLVTMYMSQYMEQHSCSSLIGAAPG
jgi:ATP-dependent Clp protease ATP-binding subunit ClpA